MFDLFLIQLKFALKMFLILLLISMGVGRVGKGAWTPFGLSYMIPLMGLSTSTRFVKTSQLSPTALVLCCAS